MKGLWRELYFLTIENIIRAIWMLIQFNQLFHAIKHDAAFTLWTSNGT